MRLSNLWVARVLGAQNSQAPRSSHTSATNLVAHTILNNKCDDEWTKDGGLQFCFLNFVPARGGYTISEFEFCARVRGHQQLPFLNFVPAYGLHKSLKNIKKTSYFGHAWNTNTSRNIADFQKGKRLAPYLLSPRCALIAHRASPSGFSHFPMGAKRKSWRLIREARRERRM